MDEIITAIRRAIIDEEEAGEMISTSTFGEEAKAKPTPEAALLSRVPNIAPARYPNWKILAGSSV